MKHQVNPRELLHVITLYRNILVQQLYDLFPMYDELKIDAAIRYLIQRERVQKEEDMISCYFDQSPVDETMIKALWILSNFNKKYGVQEHWLSNYPGLIYFYMNGDYYEIVHARDGHEKMLLHYGEKEEDAKKIVLIDTEMQKNKIILPNLQGFCMVNDSNLIFYKVRREGNV